MSELLATCKEALAAAGEADVELHARRQERGIARFAIGELGQHMELVEPLVTVRVARGRRVAEAVTTRLDRASIVEAIHDAARAAAVVPEIEGFAGFAGPSELLSTPPRFAEATAHATAEERSAIVGRVLTAVRGAGLVAAGLLSTARTSFAIATTSGCLHSHESTTANFKVWALETAGAGGAAGYGGHIHRDLRALAVDAETERAIRSASMGKGATPIEPGAYDVVMEPAALAELLEWLGMIAFAAPDVEQGTSPLAGRIGERVTGENVTITEDPLDASDLGFAVPFDREGTPRRRIPLIENGVAKNVLYDRTYAARMAGSPDKSTGSGVVPDFAASGGVAASSLHVAGGAAESVEELVSGIDRGLYVCRLHYVNGFVEPRRSVMTGITRDGCFLVERGKITRPVTNLRFTDSFLEALGRCDAMTRTCTAIGTWWSDLGACVVPAVRIRKFQFTGSSR